MIVIVDLSNVMWSTFHSSLKFNRVEADTCPKAYTGHVEFFHQKFVKILQDQPCHDYFFALDRKPVKKYQMFSEYKRTRGKIKFDPKPAIMDVLISWGSKVIYSEDNEADDAIASYIGAHLDTAITVASTDKDLWQLCEIPHVKVYNFQKGNFVTPVELKEAYELDSFAHVKLHKTLWGDSSDNVPNLVPRMQKQLLPLIKKSDGSLRSFWKTFDENKSELSKKCIDTLETNRDKLKINYELVRLNFDCEIIVEVAKKEEKKKEEEKEIKQVFPDFSPEDVPF